MNDRDPQPARQLTFRQALNEHDAVVADVVAEGRGKADPKVTIALPTFRRPDLLIESVASALHQDYPGEVEIIVVDNDPQSNAEALLAALPELAERNFRYYVNRSNIGPFQNWNRCIELARAGWVTVLNDDDLLMPAFVSTMFEEIERRPTVDGIVCSKLWFGRAAPTAEEARHTPLLNRLTSRIVDRAVHEFIFKGRQSRRIHARKMFWGAIPGNGGGFLFRRATAYRVGGYYPEDYPSADTWFYARFAKIGHLRQHRAFLARIRRTEGSISNGTIIEQIAKSYALQQILVETEGPRWRRRLLPTMIAHYRMDFARDWDLLLPKNDLERLLQLRLPPHRPWLYQAFRLMLGGF